MKRPVYVLGEALMDCVAQPDGSLLPHMGGSPFNLARAAGLRGAEVRFLNPLSTDLFGVQMRSQLRRDGVATVLPDSPLPTALAVVQVDAGQPRYGFYREGIADRDYSVQQVLDVLGTVPPAILHTGSLLLVPPEQAKVLAIVQAARTQGWTISVDVNLRPRLARDLSAYLAAVKAVAACADWLKASDEDLALLGFADAGRHSAPAVAGYYRALGVRRMAFTFGEQGAWLEVDGAVAQADVPQVALRDTVGAGDTFWGNCVADWALQAPGAAQRVDTTLRQAMAAAAINCTRAGCQPPAPAEVEAFLAGA
jgi:fructokinase